MTLRYMDENALAAADILTTGSALAALSPDTDHPITDAFLTAQSAHWMPPTTAFTLRLSAGLSRAFALVWSGTFTTATAAWLDSAGTQLGATQTITGDGCALSETTEANAHSWQLTATGDVRIYRIMRGSMQAVSCAIDPSSEVPRYGLRPDFQSEPVSSDANRFHGRFGRRAGEMAVLNLTQISKGDTVSQGIRAALMDGETLIDLRLQGESAATPFYAWADGIVPPADLSNSLRWDFNLPIRYWSNVR